MADDPAGAGPDVTADVIARGEILFPHDPAAGPVTAVRNVVIQSSLARLKANNQFERYATLVAPDVLDELTSRLGPGWIPVQLVLAHYEACEGLGLADRELAATGAAVGDRLQETTLVSVAKRIRPKDFDLWSVTAQLHRMWARLYRGGSVQIRKLGPKAEVIELWGFPMNRFAYHRKAQAAALTATHAGVGVDATVKMVSYDEERDEIAYHMTWD